MPPKPVCDLTLSQLLNSVLTTLPTLDGLDLPPEEVAEIVEDSDVRREGWLKYFRERHGDLLVAADHGRNVRSGTSKIIAPGQEETARAALLEIIQSNPQGNMSGYQRRVQEIEDLLTQETVLIERILDLEEENEDLKGKVAKLTRQVKALNIMVRSYKAVGLAHKLHAEEPRFCDESVIKPERRDSDEDAAPIA